MRAICDRPPGDLFDRAELIERPAASLLMLSTAKTEAVVPGLKYVTQFGDDVLKAAARDAAAEIASVPSVAARETPQEPISLPNPRAGSSLGGGTAFDRAA
jgi:predicted DNA-binding transcriptional regulator YafY